MRLIVGLGNPGTKYQNTRHNIGFMVLDKLCQNFKIVKKYNALIYKDNNVIFLKPQSYMNNSGQAVSQVAAYYKIEPKNIYVIYDDKDLPFGKLRIRTNGSAGGHNGIKSIIANLNSQNFVRFRIGIKNEDTSNVDTADFVLSKFTSSEKNSLNHVLIAVIEAVELAIVKGVQKAMNNFN
ncbi:MAG: aminoacyl-tRNA hydrolase [Patescibacteria group bacterium]